MNKEWSELNKTMQTDAVFKALDNAHRGMLAYQK